MPKRRDICIDPVSVRSCTPSSPASDSFKEPPAAKLTDQWSATVTLTGVHATEPGTCASYRSLCPLFYKTILRNLAADTKRLFDYGEKYSPACYLILALIPSFNSSSFNSLIELRAASISIFTGTSIPPPTRHLPLGSLTWSLLGVKKSFGHAQISLL